MQIDMHYYGTYCLARSAGFTQGIARVIATAAQFVDDNAQRGEVELTDASQCQVEATAHHTLDFSNIDADDQRKVWVPFHFLPGNEGGEFTERLICRKDSQIAQEMCDHHLTQSNKPFFFPLVGILAHVYGDTFAHYGFSGVSSRKNRVINNSFEFQQDLDEGIKQYILDKKDRFFARFTPYLRNIKSALAEHASGALGHGAVVTFPDRPYLTWRFTYEDGRDSGWRDNQATFLAFCEKMHGIFYAIASRHPDWFDYSMFQTWEALSPKVANILALQADKGGRIQAWEDAAQGALFNHAEPIPAYQDWNEGFRGLQHGESHETLNHPIYQFYQAASYHRWYVLRELLPRHGIMVI